MAGSYVKEADGMLLNIPSTYLQSFHHKAATDRTHNESITIRWFVNKEPDIRLVYNEILIFLSKFQFVTYSYIRDFLINKGYDIKDSLSDILNEMVEHRILNYFYLCELPEEPEDKPNQEIPDDAYIVYCMDNCAKQILIHFYRDDFIYWRTTDCYKNTEQIIKYISTCAFYIALNQVKRDNLKRFDPLYDANIGRRTSRYSAIFETSNGLTESRQFILESIRSYDLPGGWDKKVGDQVLPYVTRSYWKQTFRDYPYFVLLTENYESAEMASGILARRLPELKFCVTTDEEVRKGLANATFYKYVSDSPVDSENPDEPIIGHLKTVRASIFTKYTS